MLPIPYGWKREKIDYKSIVLFLFYSRNAAKRVGASIWGKIIYVQFLFRSAVIE